MDLSILDIGGGFPGHKGEEGYFSQVACAIRAGLSKWFGGEDVTVIAEPGRYFAASTHTLAVCVTSKREECAEDGRKVGRDVGVSCFLIVSSVNIALSGGHFFVTTGNVSCGNMHHVNGHPMHIRTELVNRTNLKGSVIKA